MLGKAIKQVRSRTCSIAAGFRRSRWKKICKVNFKILEKEFFHSHFVIHHYLIIGLIWLMARHQLSICIIIIIILSSSSSQIFFLYFFSIFHCPRYLDSRGLKILAINVRRTFRDACMSMSPSRSLQHNKLIIISIMLLLCYYYYYYIIIFTKTKIDS